MTRDETIKAIERSLWRLTIIEHDDVRLVAAARIYDDLVAVGALELPGEEGLTP